MNLGLDFRRGVDTLPDAMEKMVARINVIFSKEHDPATGAHRDITAKSITADTLTFTDGRTLGTMAFQNANAVSISGGTITGSTSITLSTRITAQGYVAHSGSSSSPAYGFDIGTTTGMFMAGTGVNTGLGFSCGGTEVIFLDKPNNIGFFKLPNLYLRAHSGSGIAQIVFCDPADVPRTNIRCSATGAFEFWRNGPTENMYHMDATGLYPNGSRFLGRAPGYFWTAVFAQNFYPPLGTNAVPSYSFDGYGSTGMYMISSGGSTIGFSGDGSQMLQLERAGSFARFNLTPVPWADGWFNCGLSTLRWATVFAQNGTISTSDLRLKDVKGSTPLGLDFIKQLHPVEYGWLDKPGKRRHGLIAQELKALLDELQVEFDGVHVPESESGAWGLNYTELIAPIVKAIQELDAKVDALRSQYGTQADG